MLRFMIAADLPKNPLILTHVLLGHVLVHVLLGHVLVHVLEHFMERCTFEFCFLTELLSDDLPESHIFECRLSKILFIILQ